MPQGIHRLLAVTGTLALIKALGFYPYGQVARFGFEARPKLIAHQVSQHEE